MTESVSTGSTDVRTLPAVNLARDWLRSRSHQAIAALVLYAGITIAYFGVHVLPHLGGVCLCTPNGGGADPSIIMWDLAWWPHALLHGLNPFFTNALFAPNRVDLGGIVMVPGAALATAPITLLFGPFVSYNLVMLASPVLAAFFAFLLCRYVSGSFAAALFGGYVFGFCGYILGHLPGQTHLVLVFPVPAMVHLTLRLIDGRIGQRRFIALMALALAAQVSFSTEVAATFVLIGLVALVVAFIFAPAARARLIGAVKSIVAAGAIAALVTSPIIYYSIKASIPPPSFVGTVGAGDALAFLVPTILIRFGSKYFAAVSVGFTGTDAADAGIYIGLPLALILARYGITRWRLVSTRILFVVLAIVVVLLLGSRLHIATYPTIPLPWQLLDHSLLRSALPVRLSVYMFLIVAVIMSMWLGHPRAGRWGLAKWALAALSIAFLVPNIGSGLWRSHQPNPRFFTTLQYRSVLHRGETVLVLPFGPFDMSMLWQAETGEWFRMAGGYVSGVPLGTYLHDPLLPALDGQVKPNPALLRSFLVRRHVQAVIVDPGNPDQWPGALAALGLKPLTLGGVLVYRV
jgi:hypothetical protein